MLSNQVPVVTALVSPTRWYCTHCGKPELEFKHRCGSCNVVGRLLPIHRARLAKEARYAIYKDSIWLKDVQARSVAEALAFDPEATFAEEVR